MPVYGPRHSPYSYYLCRTPDIAAVETICNVFSYDAVSARDSNLSPSWRRADALRVVPRSRVALLRVYIIILKESSCMNLLYEKIVTDKRTDTP